MDDELRSIVKDMANLLADLSEATADLVHDSASHLQSDLVGRTRDKARSFRDSSESGSIVCLQSTYYSNLLCKRDVNWVGNPPGKD